MFEKKKYCKTAIDKGTARSGKKKFFMKTRHSLRIQ